MGTYVVNNPAQAAKLGHELAQGLCGGEVLAFTGGLGSGKTTFCRGIAEGLGCVDAAFSPTFAIANFYRGKMPLAHFDAYRICCIDDFEAAGFYDYLEQGAVVAVEWSENVQELLPQKRINIDITINADESRTIKIKGAKQL